MIPDTLWSSWIGLPARWEADPRTDKAACCFRTVNALAEQHRRNKPGLGLLEVTHDPREGRRYLVTLSRRGQAIARTLGHITTPTTHGQKTGPDRANTA